MLTSVLLRKKVDSIRESFRKNLRRVRDSSIITAAATCFDELILDTEMYEQSWESAHACVVKYIRARLPSQARRAGLASQTRTCMGTFTEMSLNKHQLSSHFTDNGRLFA
jgi:hypothetical protein